MPDRQDPFVTAIVQPGGHARHEAQTQNTRCAAGVRSLVPRLSQSYEIYISDHQRPHFHAIYGEHEALVRIDDGSSVRGDLARTARRLVHEWLHLHRDELAVNWQRAQAPKPSSRWSPLGSLTPWTAPPES